jgi:sortase (surface protein transpeptidase)
VTLPVPAAVTDPALSLRAAAVATPLELEIPALKVKAPVLAVGITTANVMAAPEGPPNDPVWQETFWYRGGSIPGAVGTATIAGHVDDSVGRYDVFGHLQNLRPGDAIVVRDQRSGLAVVFSVTETETYTLAQAADPAVLARIYGDGPVRGVGPQPSADGLAHLTLVTCSGTFQTSAGTHDHRLVVYATRVG